MIDRFRFSKPTPQEDREKSRFWWNDESYGITFKLFFKTHH